jgi:hypothetical protein
MTADEFAALLEMVWALRVRTDVKTEFKDNGAGRESAD